MSSFRLGTAVRSTGIVYSSFRAHEMTQLSQTPCLCALYEPYPALAAVLACAFSPTSINDDLLRAKSTAFAWARCFYLVLLYYYPYESIRCFLGPLVSGDHRAMLLTPGDRAPGPKRLPGLEKDAHAITR